MSPPIENDNAGRLPPVSAQNGAGGVDSASAPASAEEAAGDAARSALRDAGSHVRFWLVVGLGLTLDLWSKHWAFSTLGQHGHRELIPNVLEFQIMLNKGALFGIGQGLTNVFLIASVAALFLVAWMFAHSSVRSWGLHIALGGLVAGALGNMYDRATVRLLDDALADSRGRLFYVTVVGQSEQGRLLVEAYPPGSGRFSAELSAGEIPREVGFVRDFIKIPTKLWNNRDLWPWVFNVADMLLVGGIGIVMIYLLRERRTVRQPAAGLDASPDRSA